MREVYLKAIRPDSPYQELPFRAALLLREKLDQKQLGSPYVIVANAPVEAPGDDALILGLSRSDKGDYVGGWWADPDADGNPDELLIYLAPRIPV